MTDAEIEACSVCKSFGAAQALDGRSGTSYRLRTAQLGHGGREVGVKVTAPLPALRWTD